MNTFKNAPKWDKHRAIFLKIGLIQAMAIALMAFNYTSYAPAVEEYIIEEPPPPDVLNTPPITVHRKKEVPPPPKPKVVTNIKEIVLEDPVLIDEEDVFDEPIEDINDELLSDVGEGTYTDPAPKVVEVIEEPVDKGPYLFVERMPVYKTCGLDGTEEERKQCSQEKLMEVVYKNVRYPDIARDNDQEGTVVASFIVSKSGEIKDVEIVRDFGFGSGEAVLKALKKVGSFYPGKQNGRPVNVIYRIPVKFKLH